MRSVPPGRWNLLARKHDLRLLVTMQMPSMQPARQWHNVRNLPREYFSMPPSSTSFPNKTVNRISIWWTKQQGQKFQLIPMELWMKNFIKEPGGELRHDSPCKNLPAACGSAMAEAADVKHRVKPVCEHQPLFAAALAAVRTKDRDQTESHTDEERVKP